MIGAQSVLRIPELTVAEGELFAVMGPNGAGKSTLLRVLLGLQPLADGSVHVLGESVNELTGGAVLRLRRRVGYIPQLLYARGELPLTVREVVAIGRTGRAGLWHRLGRADWQAVDYWLERLGIAALAGRGFGEISGGEQRKTMIACAMAQEPRLLLLDEPTANLDLGWREKLVATIQSLYESAHLTIVLVCHEPEVLPPGCRRVALLNRGELLDVGAPSAVFTESRLAQLYGMPLSLARQQDRYAIVPGGGARGWT